MVRYEPTYSKILRSGVEMVLDRPDLFPITRKYSYSNDAKLLPFGNGARPEIPIMNLYLNT